jgi:fructose-bisphosphate aldolase class 1
MEHAQMNVQQLEETAQALFASDKGLHAMEESNGTCNKRFAKLGIPQAIEARRAYRELIVTTPELADATVNCFLRAVPASAQATAFLSGGQPAELATAHLNAMNVKFKSRLPWALAFSFARAIQQPALELWKGQKANVLAAQQALYHRAHCNQVARSGKYFPAMEKS